MTDVDLAAPPDEVSGFPTRTLKPGTGLHRIHHRGLGPCWFSSAEPNDRHGGRFDLPSPDGTSYWALQPAAAFLETIARRPVSAVPSELIDRFSFSSVRLPSPLTIANTPVKRARRFGLTGEFHTTVHYEITRAWAAALRRSEFDGLTAIPRHDVTGRLRSVALFGRGGEHVPPGWAPRLQTSALPTDLVDEMSTWGIRVVPIPTEVDTVDPPSH